LIGDIIPAFILAAIIAASLQTILIPYSNYKNFFEDVNGVPVSHISQGEFEASNWLRSHVDVVKNPNALVMSDPATSQIVRGMTGLNSTASRHPSVSIQGWQTLQLNIKELLSPTSSGETEKVIGSVRNGTQATDVYIVLSKRTCWWSSQPSLGSIRFMPMPGVYSWEYYCSLVDDKFKNALVAEEIYRNKDVTIYSYT
jgi:hypothetical protein